MSNTLRTLSIGTRQHPAQFPVRNFAAATQRPLAAGVAVTVSLAAGHYEIRSDVAVTYRHGAPGAVAGHVAVPHDAGVWLGVSLAEAADLIVTPAADGTIWIVPAETV